MRPFGWLLIGAAITLLLLMAFDVISVGVN